MVSDKRQRNRSKSDNRSPSPAPNTAMSSDRDSSRSKPLLQRMLPNQMPVKETSNGRNLQGFLQRPLQTFAFRLQICPSNILRRNRRVDVAHNHSEVDERFMILDNHIREGAYKLKMKLTDADGNQLTCGNINFKIVHSSLIAQI